MKLARLQRFWITPPTSSATGSSLTCLLGWLNSMPIALLDICCMIQGSSMFQGVHCTLCFNFTQGQLRALGLATHCLTLPSFWTMEQDSVTPQSCIFNVFQTNIVWTTLPSFATSLKCTLMSLNSFGVLYPGKHFPWRSKKLFHLRLFSFKTTWILLS